MKRLIVLIVTMLMLTSCSKSDGNKYIVTTNPMLELMVKELYKNDDTIKVKSLSKDYVFVDTKDLELEEIDIQLLEEADYLIHLGAEFDSNLLLRIPDKSKRRLKVIDVSENLNKSEMSSSDNAVDNLKDYKSMLDNKDEEKINLGEYFEERDEDTKNLYERFELSRIEVKDVGESVNNKELKDYVKRLYRSTRELKLEITDDNTGNIFVFEAISSDVNHLILEKVILANGEKITEENKGKYTTRDLHVKPEMITNTAGIIIEPDLIYPVFINFGSKNSLKVIAETITNEIKGNHVFTEFKKEIDDIKLTVAEDNPALIFTGNINPLEFKDWYDKDIVFVSMIDSKDKNGRKNITKIKDYLMNFPDTKVVKDASVLEQYEIENYNYIDLLMFDQEGDFLANLKETLTIIHEAIFELQ